MDKAKQRVVYLDYVRAAALFCVIMMHTGFDDLSPATGFGTWLHQCFVILLRIAIPCFFMASGALLLGREEDFGTLLRHRFLRFVLVILLIQAIQYVYMFRHEPWKMYLQYYFQIVYSGQFAAHTWYLYSYLAFLLMLPLLRRLVKGLDGRHYVYLFSVYLAYKAAASLGDLIWGGEFLLNPEFSVSFVLARDAVIYPLLGYALHHVLAVGARERSRRFALLLWGAGLAALAVSALLRMLSRRVSGSFQFDPYTFIAIPTAAFFFGMRVLCVRRAPGRRIAALFSLLSQTSFATYLFHNMYLELFAGLKTAAAAVTGPYLACAAQGLAALILGTAVSFVLKQIPGLKKLL